jgi:hypothetical protein
LIDRLPGAKGPHPNRVSQEVALAILEHCLQYPTHGCLRVAQELQLKGLDVSSGGVRAVFYLKFLPGSQSMRVLEGVFRDSWETKVEGFTLPSEDPVKRTGYILHDKKNHRVVKKTATGYDYSDDAEWSTLLKLASDHLPVIAEIELQTK